MFITRRKHNQIVKELQEKIEDLEQRSKIKDEYIRELMMQKGLAESRNEWTSGKQPIGIMSLQRFDVSGKLMK